MRTAIKTAGLVAALAALAVPGVAQAKTKAVFMGVPTKKASKQFQNVGTDVNDFFPHGIAVHVGDSVSFVPTGFHTVDLIAKGGQPQPLFGPTGDKVSGVNDAGGQPFWFNGNDQIFFNPA